MRPGVNAEGHPDPIRYLFQRRRSAIGGPSLVLALQALLAIALPEKRLREEFLEAKRGRGCSGESPVFSAVRRPDGRGHTARFLASRLGCTAKSARRYLDALAKAGFITVDRSGRCYRIGVNLTAIAGLPKLDISDQPPPDTRTGRQQDSFGSGRPTSSSTPSNADRNGGRTRNAPSSAAGEGTSDAGDDRPLGPPESAAGAAREESSLRDEDGALLPEVLQALEDLRYLVVREPDGLMLALVRAGMAEQHEGRFRITRRGRLENDIGQAATRTNGTHGLRPTRSW